jgi:F-type H+-transporting ATPase subunit epsilon
MDTMDKNTLHLTIVSQEKKLLEKEVDSVTLDTAMGEITILPNHVPLMSELVTGELRYLEDGSPESVIISKGFLNLAPNNQMMVMVDSAVHQRDISEEKARQAVAQANQTMSQTTDRHELLMAEASLKRAMLELRVAQKTTKAKI